MDPYAPSGTGKPDETAPAKVLGRSEKLWDKLIRISLCFGMWMGGFCRAAQATENANASEYARQRDVVYGRKCGMALTMDVFTPKNANGIGVLWVISSGGRSSAERIDSPSRQKCFRTLLGKGYTVFAVVHSSAPRFTLQDMVPDIHRAVRFVRCRAQDFRIDARQLGIVGASAGGALALLMGTTGRAGDPNHADPVERTSSKVHAVGCFFGPSDWLNFDGQGTDVLAFQKTRYGAVDPSFVFYDTDPKQQTRSEITDKEKIQVLLKEYSPIAHVTGDDAPTLIIHGEADPFVPIRQSTRFVHRLQENHVPCRLVVKPGQGHGWDGWEDDTALTADWFDTHLRPESAAARPLSQPPLYGSNPEKGAYAQINGVRLYYERYGRGGPILLLHGGTSHIARQGPLIDLLRRHYEVIAVDTRGHGRSTLDDRPMTYPLLADDMAKLLEELRVGPVTIVGHSDGGVIGYILAAKYPTKVRALVANGANFRKTGRGGMTPRINEWIKTITPAMAEQWGDIRPPYERLNPEANWDRFITKVKELWQSETDLAEEDLKAIRCPVLISHGDRDTFVNLADIVWMYEQIPGANLYVAPNGGHGHHDDQIEAFGPILLRFLNRVHTTGRTK